MPERQSFDDTGISQVSSDPFIIFSSKNNSMPIPNTGDYPAYFEKYISLVTADSPSEAIANYSALLLNFFNSLPEEKANYAYATGKWTLKEVLQHMIDTERIFSYRILRISRNDTTPLASFDENHYAENAVISLRSLTNIKEEFIAVRKSTDLLILSLSNEQLSHFGTASNQPVTANAIGFMVFGHLLHHKKIIEEKYL